MAYILALIYSIMHVSLTDPLIGWIIDEFQSEWAGINARAQAAGVIDIEKAIEEFKAHALRGKTNLGSDWQVCMCAVVTHFISS
jgi:hypothetical protein